jgi:hypothetical protein
MQSTNHNKSQALSVAAALRETTGSGSGHSAASAVDTALAGREGSMYTLDDSEPFSLESFKADNADGIDREWSEVETMVVGGSITLGGGASAEFVLRRVR